MQVVLDWGINFILMFQGATDALVGFFSFFTYLGDENFYLLLFPLLYWCFDNDLRLRVGVYFAICVLINLALKAGIHTPRPYWASSHVKLLTSPSSELGMPSGHTQNATVIWGTFAAYFRNRAVTALAIAIIILIGLSRIYLGVHYPTDVMGGWLVGILLLLLLLRYEKAVVGWFSRQATRTQLVSVVLLGFCGILIGAAVTGFVAAFWEVPSHWETTAAIQAPNAPLYPLSLTGFVTIMSVLTGLLYGHFWLSARDRFDPNGTLAIKVARYILGVIGVVIIWAGLDAAFSAIAHDESTLGLALRYIRYGLVGLWIGCLAPMLFKRLRLA